VLTLIEISCNEVIQVRTYHADQSGWRAALRDFRELVREDVQDESLPAGQLEDYLQTHFPDTWPPAGNLRYRQGDLAYAGSPEYQVFLWIGSTDGEAPAHAGSPEYQVFLWIGSTDGEAPAHAKAFKVVTVSDNLDSFGNRGHVLVAADGQAFEVSRPMAANCGGGFADYVVGDVVELSVRGEDVREWARHRFSCVRPLGSMPPLLLSRFWPQTEPSTKE
jgi:hypothetical protein